MMKKKLLIGLSILIAFIGVIAFVAANSPNRNDFLAKYDLDGMTVKEIVAYLENDLNEPTNFSAAITGTKLVLGDATHQIELELPKGQFYLSFAPYINQTHPCANHNLVTCRGELKNKSFEVKIVDSQTNTVIVEKTIISSSNGFAGIWLPKNKRFQVTVSYGNLTATEEVSTFTSSNTCLTTLKLA
jgi:hypothetical protein